MGTTSKTGADGQAFADNVEYVGCGYGHPQSMTLGGLDRSSSGLAKISSFSKEQALSSIETNIKNVGISCVDVEVISIFRYLTEGEIKMAKRMFSNSQGKSVIPYEKVRIYKNNFGHFANVPVTPAGDINWPEKEFKPDFSKSHLGDQRTFIHEMVHVWQHYMGLKVWAGSAASQVGSVVFHSDRNHAYDYSLDSGELFGSFNTEQQGNIVAAYYSLRFIGPHQEIFVGDDGKKYYLYDAYARGYIEKNNLISIYKNRTKPGNESTYENVLSPYKATLKYFLQDPVSKDALRSR